MFWAAAAAAAAAAASLLLAGASVLLAADRDLRTLAAAGPGPGGARHLTPAPNLSFTDDSSPYFPIRGENLEDGKIAADRPTVIFFGTSHCWNTNREAERVVALAAKEKEAVRFLVVDLAHPSRDQRALVSRFYRGHIPTLTFIDASGNVVYSKSGETSARRGDTSGLEAILRKASWGDWSRPR